MRGYFDKVVEKYSNPCDENEIVLQAQKSKSNEYAVTLAKWLKNTVIHVMKMKMCYMLKNQNQINVWSLQFDKVVEKYNDPCVMKMCYTPKSQNQINARLLLQS